MVKGRYKYIYGPVASWRLGRSLGIDPVYTVSGKICSFDCIYCQAGKTRSLTEKRKIFIPTEKILDEIKSFPPVKIDYITFSGAGEPTLAKNLGKIIRGIKKIKKAKIAVLTNSSTIGKSDVRRDLALADFVIAKLDAHSQKLFSEIDSPLKKIKLEKVIKGLKKFRSSYKKKFALQIMFTEKNKNDAKKIASLTREINPDEIQINTPTRPCGIKPLSAGEIVKIKTFFKGIKVSSVYDAEKKRVKPVSKRAVLKRRGKA